MDMTALLFENALFFASIMTISLFFIQKEETLMAITIFTFALLLITAELILLCNVNTQHIMDYYFPIINDLTKEIEQKIIN